MEDRLQKVIARAGLASRREAEKLIETGRVTVNGRVVREMGVKVDPALDVVAVDTIPIRREAAAGEERRTYLLLNKPKGVLCTVKDPHGRRTVLDLAPPRPGRRLYPVGRLDEDSEGLVILTDDGEITDLLTHPRHQVPKVYELRVRGRFTQEHAQKLERGVWLSEGKTGRSRVRVRKAGREISHVTVTLTEGRNREIRRAFARLEFHVLSLRRTQIGPVVGRGVKLGQFRPLKKDEVVALRKVATEGGSSRPLRRRPPRGDAKGGAGGRRGGGAGGGGKPRRRPGKPDPGKTPRGRSRVRRSGP